MDKVVKKSILVTGPDGFVGSYLCEELIKRNHIVRGALWHSAPLAAGCESVVVGDINKTTSWQVALEGIDALVHLAARVHVMTDTSDDPLSAFREVNVEGTKRLAECATKVGVQQFVYVSSIKVNGESTDIRPFTETDSQNPKSPYAISKYEAEQILRDIETATDMSVTILRPPLIYGPGVKANFMKMIQFIEKGVPLPLGSVKNKRSILGLGNFADLICLCIENDAAKGETFLVSDGCDLSTADLARKISYAWNKKPRVVSLSPRLLRVLGCVLGKREMISRLTESLVIDSTKVRRTLGWTPRYSVEEELNRTIEWYRLQK